MNAYLESEVIFYVFLEIFDVIYQVAMGQDAVEINNKFLEVIRPIVARLTNIGVIQNRDYRTVCLCLLVSFFFFYWFQIAPSFVSK